jgi:hypothetical protein
MRQARLTQDARRGFSKSAAGACAVEVDGCTSQAPLLRRQFLKSTNASNVKVQAMTPLPTTAGAGAGHHRECHGIEPHALPAAWSAAARSSTHHSAWQAAQTSGRRARPTQLCEAGCARTCHKRGSKRCSAPGVRVQAAHPAGEAPHGQRQLVLLLLRHNLFDRLDRCLASGGGGLGGGRRAGAGPLAVLEVVHGVAHVSAAAAGWKTNDSLLNWHGVRLCVGLNCASSGRQQQFEPFSDFGQSRMQVACRLGCLMALPVLATHVHCWKYCGKLL